MEFDAFTDIPLPGTNLVRVEIAVYAQKTRRKPRFKSTKSAEYVSRNPLYR